MLGAGAAEGKVNGSKQEICLAATRPVLRKHALVRRPDFCLYFEMVDYSVSLVIASD